MLDIVNQLLNYIYSQVQEEQVNDWYEELQDEYFCRMVADVTMDDVGSEFDPKIA